MPLAKTTLTAALLTAIPLLACAESKSIYGYDDRLDFYQAQASMRTLSDSVVSLWDSANVTPFPSGYNLATKNYGTTYGLCPYERFREQPIGAFCSGALVGEDLIMTAGHCVTTEAQCRAIKFVFGYRVPGSGKPATTAVWPAEVYGCAGIVKRYLDEKPADPANPGAVKLGPDYALIRLDRKVSGRKPLQVNRSGIAAGASIFVIGHPVGLPLKIAPNASVRNASLPGYFTADLDTFGGNSGSPVFNLYTNKIEGILVRGDEDFAKSPAGCITMAAYAQTGGRGEDVTKVSVLSAYIPRLPGEKSEPVYEAVDTSALRQPAGGAPERAVTFD